MISSVGNRRSCFLFSFISLFNCPVQCFSYWTGDLLFYLTAVFDVNIKPQKEGESTVSREKSGLANFRSRRRPAYEILLRCGAPPILRTYTQTTDLCPYKSKQGEMRNRPRAREKKKGQKTNFASGCPKKNSAKDNFFCA